MSETFGNYTLVRRLARGGMGEVLLATQRGPDGFERRVAIKRILPQVSANRDFVTMFLDEARLVASFTHPNIVQIFDFGKIKRTYYLAMEYLQGASLNLVLRRSARRRQMIPIGHAVKLVSQACLGLDYAHNYTSEQGAPLNLIHRDVSPHNLMLTYDGVVKLLDFGVAKAKSNVYETRGVSLKGKIAYMSPEQIRAKGELDRRSDIFSLGIVLYELLTLKPPFPGQSDYEYMDAIVKRSPVDPREFNQDVDARLAEIVLRTLEKDPADRYPTARELVIDLEQFLVDRRLVVDAYTLGQFLQDLVPRIPDDSSPAGTDGAGSSGVSGPTTEPLKPRPPGRSRLLLVGLAGLAGLIAAFALFALWPSGVSAPPKSSLQPSPGAPSDLGSAEVPPAAADAAPADDRTLPALDLAGPSAQPGSSQAGPSDAQPAEAGHAGPRPKPRSKRGHRASKVRIALPDTPVVRAATQPARGPSATAREADRLATEALEALRRGRTSRAISLYRRAMREDPNNRELNRMLANAYAKAGSKKEAIHYYERYLETCPGCPFTADVRTYLADLRAEQEAPRAAPVSRINIPASVKTAQPTTVDDRPLDQPLERPGERSRDKDTPDLKKLDKALKKIKEQLDQNPD